MSLYGKYNASGVHENDPEPVPNYYDPERKVFFKDFERFYHPQEKSVMDEEDKVIEIPLGKKLKNPKTLLDIVQYGIDHSLYSNNAIYELLEQLYNLESHNVLICVDEYNFLFRPSKYPSFRYSNDKFLKGRIPPYHMSLCRAFLHFDGHKIKNGFKIVASSITDHLDRHKFIPDDIYFPKGYDFLMKGLLLDDYRSLLEYYHNVKMWRPSEKEEDDGNEIESLWMQTQGNWLQTLNIMLKCANQ